MEEYLMGGVIGVVIGAIAGIGAIMGTHDVRSRDTARKEERSVELWRTVLFVTKAENAQLRISLAAGSLSEEGKKVAEIVMDALSAVRASKAVVFREFLACED